MSQSNANKWIHLLHPVLNQALADQERLPARTADDLAAMSDNVADRRLCSRLPFFHEGTERPIQRPKDPEAQQEYDSGKKTMPHAQKPPRDQRDLSRVFLEPPYEGKASDKSMADLIGDTLPPGSCLYQDKGFQGFFLPGITIVQPKKTPPGGDTDPDLRRRTIVEFPPSAFGLNTRLVA